MNKNVNWFKIYWKRFWRKLNEGTCVFTMNCPCCGEKMNFLTYVKPYGYTIKANLGNGIQQVHVPDLLEFHNSECDCLCEWSKLEGGS